MTRRYRRVRLSTLSAGWHTDSPIVLNLKDSLVLICRNCNSAWTCSEETFTKLEFAVMIPPSETREITCYLPFWRMKPRIEGMELASYADLIRVANLPKAITPDFAAAQLFFWSPAFKVNPAL
jgi:hypothetical protein